MSLFYFPHKDITLSYLVNYGTNGSSSLKQVFTDFRKELVLDMALSFTENGDILRKVGYFRGIPKVETPIKGLFFLSKAQIYPEPTIIETAINSALLFSAQKFGQ